RPTGPGIWDVGADEFFGDCYSNFSYKRSLTIDYNRVGLDNNPGTLSNFPALVSITMGGSEHWLKWSGAHASGHVEKEQGWDIVFKSSDGHILDHEIEEYDGTNGVLVAWVRVPSVSKSASTVIYMYYGNICILESQENVPGVWDADFKGVWH
ncbi:MAG: DUF2341 domain-containing protein, partial [Deltaproteobacteria bacterium]|nr:DUF2341 domain-containing protein [Deltaproteobacteria bacterium]